MASRFSVGVQEFLFACAYWYVASDGAIRSAERAWLAQQFGAVGGEELIKRFTTLNSTDFFDVFDGLSAALTDDQKRERKPPRCVRALLGHADAVLSLVFSSDGDWLVSGGRDTSIQVWEMRTGRPALVIRGHTFHVAGVALRRDNRLLASAGWDHTLKLWDMESGEMRLNVESAAVRFNCVTFLPDGDRLVAGCSDKSACIVPLELS